MRCLVTAGNTREAIDAVRLWTNRFSGNTGLRIAQALAERGPVDLVTSVAGHAEQVSAITRTFPFSTHAELRETLAGRLAAERYDAIFMTAAVADYLPSGAFAVIGRETLADGRERWIVEPAQRPKIKSTHDTVAFVGRRSEKIVDLFRGEWGFGGLLVKFKLEVGLTREALIAVGEASRRASGADYLVANTLEMVEGAGAGAYLLGGPDAEWVPREQLPRRLVRLVGESSKQVGE